MNLALQSSSALLRHWCRPAKEPKSKETHANTSPTRTRLSLVASVPGQSGLALALHLNPNSKNNVAEMVQNTNTSKLLSCCSSVPSCGGGLPGLHSSIYLGFKKTFWNKNRFKRLNQTLEVYCRMFALMVEHQEAGTAISLFSLWSGGQFNLFMSLDVFAIRLLSCFCLSHNVLHVLLFFLLIMKLLYFKLPSLSLWPILETIADLS